MATQLEDETIYSAGEAAEILGLSESTIAAWRCEGIGPAFVKANNSRNGRIRYFASDLRAWMESKRVVRPSAAAK